MILRRGEKLTLVQLSIGQDIECALLGLNNLINPHCKKRTLNTYDVNELAIGSQPRAVDNKNT